MSTRADRGSSAAWLAAFAATLVLLSGLFTLLVFNDAFHDLEHQRLGIEPRLTEVNPHQLVDQLQAYFVSADGSLLDHPYLSYRERLHYLEVKGVMRTVLGGLLVSIAATVGTLAWLLIGARRRGEPMQDIALRVLRNITWILLVTISAGALLALDFDRSFLKLHRLLFEGSNWIMPTYSVTARVFPAQYFFDFFLAYCGLVIGAAAAILGTLAAVRR